MENQLNLGTSIHLSLSRAFVPLVSHVQVLGAHKSCESLLVVGIMESQNGLGCQGPLTSLRTWRGAEDQGGLCSLPAPHGRSRESQLGWGLSQPQQLTGSFDGPWRWKEGEEGVGESPWSGAPARLPQVWLLHRCGQAEQGKCHLGSHLKGVLQALGFYYKQPSAGVIPAWLRGGKAGLGAGLPLHTQGSTELTPEGTPQAEPPRAPVLAWDKICVPSGNVL